MDHLSQNDAQRHNKGGPFGKLKKQTRTLLWRQLKQADSDGGGGPYVVSLHHLSTHFHLHKGRVHQPRQQPYSRLQRLRKETGEGEMVRHVPAAPAVPLVEAQVDPAGQGAEAERGQVSRAVKQPRKAQQGQ
ncbi:hypothetical protein EYF80_025111 [Liparis tanakae]|uniref:Uncharacterized protein n=1 Tax=Liparis tanakae TaxID=230148 RepID=A0A4Z2HIF0_9TELE|nr:hypothetical protein EYF80_025111 [Liparis tanakae]